MPLYEYECDACGHRFEVIQKFSDPPLDDVPEVRQGPVHKLLSSPAIQFKGTGWYITDYAKKGQSRTASRQGRRRRRSKTSDSETARQREPTAATDEERRADDDAEQPTSERPPKTRAASTAALDSARARATFRSSDLEVLAERLGEIRPPQREVDHRLQESQLVAGVVAHAFDLARVDRPRLQQLAQAVGQLDLAGAIALASPRAPGRCRASGCSGR